ncbi:MAG: Holliday junction endonuclease RuvC [Parcubacteria group bacterium Licking1014_17]|nr:MAG: Holliday junction endonuclease RuvC [Parcubacteria group bacterium Licking1014_17]
MKVLGIDPGTSLLGYGIIEVKQGTYRALEFGVFRTPPKIKNTDRSLLIYNFFINLVRKHQPDRIALEKLYFAKNITTAMGVSEIRGVLVLISAMQKTDLHEYTPLQVKQAVSSYGRAGKPQVQAMVKLILGLDKIPKPDDAADALAIAICCANNIV